MDLVRIAKHDWSADCINPIACHPPSVCCIELWGCTPLLILSVVAASSTWESARTASHLTNANRRFSFSCPYLLMKYFQ
jgi:hypothetical protein